MIDVVLDASAILAYLQGEPGADAVEPFVGRACASAVNIAEAGSRLADRGIDLVDIRRAVLLLCMQIVAFDEALAERTTMLRPATRRSGLSLGDRACLALAHQRRLPALTADRRWEGLDVDVEIRFIRR